MILRHVEERSITAVQKGEGRRDSPRFDSLFFCMRCRRNVGMHQWYKLHAFFAFIAFVIVLTLTTSTSVLVVLFCLLPNSSMVKMVFANNHSTRVPTIDGREVVKLAKELTIAKWTCSTLWMRWKGRSISPASI